VVKIDSQQGPVLSVFRKKKGAYRSFTAELTLK